MTHAEFKNKYPHGVSVGKPFAPFDYVGECVSFVLRYMKEVHNVPVNAPLGHAAQIPYNSFFNQHYQKVAASDRQVGDLMFWGNDAGSWTGAAGHTAIYDGDNKMYNQNWNGDSKVSTRTVFSPGFIGYYRPKNNIGGNMAYKYEYKKSPNYTQGRRSPITTIVIHWMVGTLKSTDAVFANPRSGVSAHYGIEDNNVHQYVDEDNTAWHAISANPYSIGIEHSAAPGRSASDSTYKTSAELIAQICTERKIPVENIQPHCKYVQTRCPGTDANGTVDEAGGIDIGRIKNDVRAILGSRTPVPVPAKRPFVRYLRIGSHGSDVDFVHRRLNKLGFYKAAYDQHFGPLTDRAVRAFQKSRGLVSDGWCGPLTWSALQD